MIGAQLVHQSQSGLVKEVRDIIGISNATTTKQWVKRFATIYDTCVKYKAGNCAELAAVACHLLISERKSWSTNPSIEYVRIWDNITYNKTLPHIVAVVARKQLLTSIVNMPVGCPGTWSHDAIICDPWDKAVYPARDHAAYWNSLGGNQKELTCTVIAGV